MRSRPPPAACRCDTIDLLPCQVGAATAIDAVRRPSIAGMPGRGAGLTIRKPRRAAIPKCRRPDLRREVPWPDVFAMALILRAAHARRLSFFRTRGRHESPEQS